MYVVLTGWAMWTPAPSTPYLFWAPTRMSGRSSNDYGLPHPPTSLHQSSFGMRIQWCSSHRWVGDICTSSSDDNRTSPPCIQAHFLQRPTGFPIVISPKSPRTKKINGKTKDISLSNLYSQHFNCEQLVGFFFGNTWYVFCFYFEPHISNTQFLESFHFKYPCICHKYNAMQHFFNIISLIYLQTFHCDTLLKLHLTCLYTFENLMHNISMSTYLRIRLI